MNFWAKSIGICIMGCFVLCIPIGNCDTISLKTRMTTSVSGDSLFVTVQFCNGGSESAHDLWCNLELSGEIEMSDRVTVLKPGGCHNFKFKTRASGMDIGTYPARIIAKFKDSIGFPFSAISANQFSIGHRVWTSLFPEAENLTLLDRGEVTFNVHNFGEKSLFIRSELFLPDEFGCLEPSRQYRLEPDEKKTLSFDVQNLFAIDGADYPAYVITEYTAPGRHYTDRSLFFIRVGDRKRVLWEFRWWLLLASAMAGMVFIYRCYHRKY